MKNIGINSKTFCILPWTHLHIPADGKLKACCRASYKLPIGDLNKNKISEIWNNEKFKKIRKNMMEGLECAECEDCYQLEKIGTPSFRQVANKDFSGSNYLIDSTSSDGHLSKEEIAFVDVRFSNICNFKCRTCNPTQSSLIAKEYEKIFPPIETAVLSVESALEDIKKMVPHLKRINFAGGEPLLHDDHYRLLEFLIQSKKTDIELCYHTNLSTFTHKNWNALKLWNFFEKVFVVASIDDVGARGEFIRKGFSWEQFKKNAKLIKVFSPRAGLKFNITINVLNVLYVDEIVDTLKATGLISSENDVSFNLLTEPVGLNVQYLKNKIPKINFQEIENFINEGKINYSTGRTEFLKLNSELDKVRLESWETLFPRVVNIFHGLE